MKNVLLVATALVLSTASLSSAMARSHERGAGMPAAQAQSQGQSYASSETKYRAATGANPYTHQFPSTDGSDR